MGSNVNYPRNFENPQQKFNSVVFAQKKNQNFLESGEEFSKNESFDCQVHPKKIDELNDKIDFIIQNTREKFDEMNKVFNENLQKLMDLQQSKTTSHQESLMESDKNRIHYFQDQSQYRESAHFGEYNPPPQSTGFIRSPTIDQNTQNIDNPMLAFIEDKGVISPNFHFTSPILSNEMTQDDNRILSPVQCQRKIFAPRNPMEQEIKQSNYRKSKTKFTGIVEGDRLEEIESVDFQQRIQIEKKMKKMKNPSHSRFPIIAPQNSRNQVINSETNLYTESRQSSFYNDGNYQSITSPQVYNNSELSQNISGFNSFEENLKPLNQFNQINYQQDDEFNSPNQIFIVRKPEFSSPQISNFYHTNGQYYSQNPQYLKKIRSENLQPLQQVKSKSNLREVKTIKKSSHGVSNHSSVSISDHYLSHESNHQQNSVVSDPSGECVIETYSDIPTIAFDEHVSQSEQSRLLKHSLEKIDEVDEEFTSTVKSESLANSSEFVGKNTISVNSKKTNMARVMEQPKSQMIDHGDFTRLENEKLKKKSSVEFPLDGTSSRSKMEIRDLKNLVNECLSSNYDYNNEKKNIAPIEEVLTPIGKEKSRRETTQQRFVDSTSNFYYFYFFKALKAKKLKLNLQEKMPSLRSLLK